MSSDLANPANLAIEARGIGKTYTLFERESDRLKHLLWGRWMPANRQYVREFRALHGVNFSIAKGEVVGIVGRNGAGKSTLLQMVCGTLSPSVGHLRVQGKVAALLELGAGFNPDFTGLENIYMNAAILGLDRQQVDARLADILAFADIGDFVRQPVKTYSSGMFMRLAFAVATSVEPDILVIDEALSVGDGAFARKSFDRIMAMKESGKTILFCSHSMYQIEALCSRAIWMEAGTVKMFDSAAEVTYAYQTSLDAAIAAAKKSSNPDGEGAGALASSASIPAAAGTARIDGVTGKVGGQEGRELDVVSGVSDLEVTVRYSIDPALPLPSVAIGFADANSQTISSILSTSDGITLKTDAEGHGQVTILIPKIPLLKGRYTVTAFLACEKALHLYQMVERSLTLNVTQKGLEQGVVQLAHQWKV